MNKILLSILLAGSLFTTACEGTSSPVQPNQGEVKALESDPCTATKDCDTGLKCVEQLGTYTKICAKECTTANQDTVCLKKDPTLDKCTSATDTEGKSVMVCGPGTSHSDLKEGDPCDKTSECEASLNLACVNNGTKDVCTKTCDATNVATVCNSPGNTACFTKKDADNNNVGVCGAPIKEGQDCTESMECGKDLACVNNGTKDVCTKTCDAANVATVCNSAGNTACLTQKDADNNDVSVCGAPKQEGQDCTKSMECGKDLACVNNGTKNVCTRTCDATNVAIVCNSTGNTACFTKKDADNNNVGVCGAPIKEGQDCTESMECGKDFACVNNGTKNVCKKS